MENLKLHQNNRGFILEQYCPGQRKEELNTEYCLVELDNMNSLPELLNQQRVLVILGLVVILKKTILIPKENYYCISTASAALSRSLILKLCLRLLQGLTLEEKSYGILWNKQLKEMSNKLWSHTKIGSPDLDLISFQKFWEDSDVQSWYSTKSIPVLKKNWYKISSPSSMFLAHDSTDLENIVKNSKQYRMILNPEQKKILKLWMRETKILYNKVIKELNDKQGFEHLGSAKGTKEQQLQTLWGQVYSWTKDVPAKIQHRTVHRAYKAWKESKLEKKNKLKLASFFDGRYITIETCPTAWKKGKLYPKFWKDLPPINLRYNHQDVSIIGNNCLTISYKYGRFYLSQPNQEIIKVAQTKELAVAIDPGVRNFATMFDGNSAFQVTNVDNLTKLAKLQAYHSKLHKKAKQTNNWFHREKIYYKMSRLKRKIFNLTKELHRKLACWLAKKYKYIYIPTYEIKKIYAKGRQNKTNRKNQLNWSWYRFVQELEYRCAKLGSVAIKVSEAYTSKTCSNCGHIHYKLGSNKLFTCPNCDHKLDRDLNGAINIWTNSLEKHLLFSQSGLG